MKQRNQRSNGQVARESPESPGWEPQRHSPYTIEGQIEGFGRFARGAARARGWRRFIARLVVWAFILSFVINAVISLINMAREMP